MSHYIITTYKLFRLFRKPSWRNATLKERLKVAKHAYKIKAKA